MCSAKKILKIIFYYILNKKDAKKQQKRRKLPLELLTELLNFMPYENGLIISLYSRIIHLSSHNRLHRIHKQELTENERLRSEYHELNNRIDLLEKELKVIKDELKETNTELGLLKNVIRNLWMRSNNQFLPSLHNLHTFGLEGISTKLEACLVGMNSLQPPAIKLIDDEFSAISEILSPSNAEFEINDFHVSALDKGLQWKVDTIVPILDIFRIAMLRKELNEIFCSFLPVMDNAPKGKDTIAKMLSLLASAPPDAVRILVCRFLTNAATHEFGREMLLTEVSTFCKLVSEQFLIRNPSLQISSSSALANFVCVLLIKCESKRITENDPRVVALESLLNTLSKEHSFGAYPPQGLICMLQTLQQMLCTEWTLPLLAIRLNLKELIVKIGNEVADERVKALVRDIWALVQPFDAPSSIH